MVVKRMRRCPSIFGSIPLLTLRSGQAIGIESAIRPEIAHISKWKPSSSSSSSSSSSLSSIAAGIDWSCSSLFLIYPSAPWVSNPMGHHRVTADSISPFCAAFFLPNILDLEHFLKIERDMKTLKKLLPSQQLP